MRKTSAEPHPTKCECGGMTQVIDSRVYGETGRRRRKCLDCGQRWTTYEIRKESPARVPTVTLLALRSALDRIKTASEMALQEIDTDLLKG